MLSLADLIPFSLSSEDMAIVCSAAGRAELGGMSNIRHEDRQSTLHEDQIVGQIGQFVGSAYLTGSWTDYLKSRWLANQQPNVGDGGCDIFGTGVDFKTSLMRSSSTNPLSFRLCVRPRERHPLWVYVLVLVQRIVAPISGYIVGWAKDSDLPSQVESNGPFSGAYVMEASTLKPMMPILRFWWPRFWVKADEYIKEAKP